MRQIRVWYDQHIDLSIPLHQTEMNTEIIQAILSQSTQLESYLTERLGPWHLSQCRHELLQIRWKRSTEKKIMIQCISATDPFRRIQLQQLIQ